MTEVSLTPHNLVKSEVNPFLHKQINQEEKDAITTPIYHYAMMNSIPQAGCRIRRHADKSSEQVGTIEWDIYPGNCILISGPPVKLRPTATNFNTTDVWWLKIAPQLYENLEASYCFQPHDPETEGFVMMSSGPFCEPFFSLTSDRLCPDGHSLLARVAQTTFGFSTTDLQCKECNMSIKGNNTSFRCDKCNYNVCLWCGASVDRLKYPPLRDYIAGDRVKLRRQGTASFPLRCLGTEERGLVGEVVGNVSNQGSLSVTCNDAASPSPGTHTYSWSELELVEDSSND